VARMMATHHVHAIAVIGLTAGDAGESLAWGIISDVDVVRAAIAAGDARAATLARRPGASVEPAMPLRDAAELLLRSGASHVLVVDSDTQHPVGVLSTFDIAGVLAWGEA
jgi:CBS domain-containing protein